MRFFKSCSLLTQYCPQIIMLKTIKALKNKYKSIQSTFTKPTIVFKQERRNNKQKNIIFILPDSIFASGGVIVSHHHSDMINALAFDGVKSSVLYPNALQFTPDKFVHQTVFKRDLNFDPTLDFVLLPEVMVLEYAHRLAQAGIKYGIHVQNGYLMDLEVRSGKGDYNALRSAYQNADIVIGNSVDTIANIKFAFPEYTGKMIHSSFVINKSRYQEIAKKQNTITYMPRKLEKHTKHVLFFLGDKLPKHWKIQAIDGVPEQTVYDMFYESKLFLSFSEFEGLAMPPAMAAMSGNRVIGYTGEANKEYFHLPCFEEVPCGDIKLFVSKILEAVARFDRNEEQLDLDSIKYLQHMFSSERQQSFLTELITSVNEVLNA